MTVAKKYYWLKLERGFFLRHDMRLLRAEDSRYPDIYLRLMCESIDHEGRLRFSDNRPYTTKELSVLLDLEEPFMTECLSAFERNEVTKECNDGELIVTLAVTRIGTETDAASRMRKHRALGTNNVTTSYRNVTQSKSIELDKEKKERTAKKLVVKTDTPPQLKDEFHRAIDEWFYTRYKYTSFGKERKAVASLAAKAKRQAQDVGEDSSEVMEAMLAAYQQLLDGSDKFWNKQPLTPSSLLALWDRVISTMRAVQPTETSSAVRGFLDE